MRDFWITLFLGWAGVHRFTQKKYVTGVVWLCTLGLLGVGWLVDIVIAFKNINKKEENKQKDRPKDKPKNKQKNKQKDKQKDEPKKQLVRSFETVITETYRKCKLDEDDKRDDLLFYIKPKWKLYLKYWERKGKPEYYVLHPNGVDVGCLREELAKILHDEYSDCEFEVTALERAYDDSHDCLTQNIRIDVYKPENALKKEESKQESEETKRLAECLNTRIVGTFAECDMDEEQYREDLILKVKKDTMLSLKYWEYNGEPAYYVLNKKGLDLGCLPKDVSKTLYEKYKDCYFDVMVTERTKDEHDNETCDIRIYVYK
jgi:hypothetical protein